MTQASESSRPACAQSLVFRLSWKSRAARTASAPLLRDFFLTQQLPPPGVPYELPFSSLGFTVFVEKCDPEDAVHTAESTHVYLLPPVPPSLNPPPVPTIETSPPLHAVLSRGLQMKPFAPKSILLEGEQRSGKSTIAAHAVVRSNATLIRLQPTHLSASNGTALLNTLKYYANAAASVAPAVLMLDDAHLTFAPFLNSYAAVFLALREHMRAITSVVLLVLTTKRTNIHPTVSTSFDLVLGLPPRRNHKRRPAPNKEDVERSWSDIRTKLPGAQEAEKYLKRLLYHPIVFEESLIKLSVRTPRAILLYGAPGTGKTSLIKAAAEATHTSVLSLQAATLARGEVGESERLLRQSFERAAADPPALVFLDEIDALFAPTLRRLPAVLGEVLDTLPSGVKVVAATNAPWMIAKSLLRPGRFDRCVLVELPNSYERRQIGQVFATRMMVEESIAAQICLRAESTSGVSGADIMGACRRAAFNAMSNDRSISVQDIDIGFDQTKPSVHTDAAENIAKWRPP
ncbi:hypothetical protein BWQ96_01515 [Gracilariopsis chorda]|uniref:AAA+ ATPase domain-containing protein n=1 Tax=Gracilariopsis chorda TaxID=448386 RepID=A0A2V3J2V3_9FLOR|nr:hypothetical protein BWQ96_01515 [Gracilariopsis chorda]|eukprot:PXF48663.1 hypothetical protein BWQ96_01515 [Gracilariopsis chorda]